MEQFGINVLNLVEQMSVIADKPENKVEQEVIYFVSGTAYCTDGYEIDIGPVQIIVNCGTEPNCDMDNPRFSLTIFNMYFHWTVNESIDEAYPD